MARISAEAAMSDSNAAQRAWRDHQPACRQCQFSAIRGLCRQGAGIQAWISEAEQAVAEREPVDVCLLALV